MDPSPQGGGTDLELTFPDPHERRPLDGVDRVIITGVSVDEELPYYRITTEAGALLFEGGMLRSAAAGIISPRLHRADVPDDAARCILGGSEWLLVLVAVDADDGANALGSGQGQLVTIEGREFWAEVEMSRLDAATEKVFDANAYVIATLPPLAPP